MTTRNGRGDKYERILTAALKVFAQKGFYQSKVSEIAKLAGVADGTIYLYFRNKDDILISLFEKVMQEAIDNLERALSTETDPARKLEICARIHLSMIDGSREAAEIVQVEVRQSFKFMKEYKNEKFYQYLNIIGAIVAEGQAKGIFRADIDPDIAKRAIFGSLDEMSLYWVLSNRKDYSIDTAARQISRIFLTGLVNK